MTSQSLRTSTIFFILITIFFLATTFYWIKKDEAPPMWDQSDYLEKSEILYQTLTQKGIGEFVLVFQNIHKEKAPLISVLPIPLYLLFGNNYDSALFCNIIFMVLVCCYTFKLSKLMSGEKEAILALVIINTFPLVFGMSREFLVEYGLMVFVIIWLYYLLDHYIAEKQEHKYYMGAVLGAGLLMKVTFPLYIIPSAIYIFVKKIRESPDNRGKIIKNITCIVIMGTIIAGVWYFRNIPSVFKYIVSSGYGEIAQHYQTGNILSLKSVADYWLYLINYGLSSYYFFLFVFLLVLKLFLFRNKNCIVFHDKTYLVLLFLWAFMPFMVFSFAVNKDYRFIIPLCPAVALAMSIMLFRLFGKYRYIFIVPVLLFPLFNYLYISFSNGFANFKKGPFILLENQLGYAHPPVSEHWPVRKILEFMSKNSQPNQNPIVATILFNHHYLNLINLNYYARNMNSNIIANEVSQKSRTEALFKIEKESDYLIEKTDILGPEFTVEKNIPVLSELKADKLPFIKEATVPLPDNSRLIIYKRTVRGFIYNNYESFRRKQLQINYKSYNFGDKIRLIGFNIEKEQKRNKIVLYWECIDTIGINYKIFLHIKNNNNNSVTSLDHYPVYNKYQTTSWRKGEIIKDETVLSDTISYPISIFTGIYDEILDNKLIIKDVPGNDPANIDGVKIL